MLRIVSWLCAGAVVAGVLSGGASADKVPSPQVTVSVKSATGCALSVVKTALEKDDEVYGAVRLCAGRESGSALYSCSVEGKGKAVQCAVTGGDHKAWDSDTLKCMKEAMQKLEIKSAGACKATISVEVQATKYRRPNRNKTDLFDF